MAHVWVLSEEAPFDDPTGSGGCVCGVYATPTAALFDLGTNFIGPDGLAMLTWTTWGANTYYGEGFQDSFYVLSRYTIQEETTLRTEVTRGCDAFGIPLHPLLACTSADLMAYLNNAVPFVE